MYTEKGKENYIERQIRAAISVAIKDECDKVIEESKATLERRLKEVLAKAAVDITSYLEFETHNNRLIITLKI